MSCFYKQKVPGMQKSQGSVLLVTLVLLLIMTVAGVTAIRMTSLEEKMSGNYLNQQMAFRAAESALIEAENHIANTAFTLNEFVNDCDDGYCFGGSDAVDTSSCIAGNINYWRQELVWSNADSHRTTNIVIDGISARAKYIIEFRCYVAKVIDGPLPDPANPGDWALYFRNNGTGYWRLGRCQSYVANNL